MSHSLSYFVYRQQWIIEEVCHQISLSSVLLSYFVEAGSFSAITFFQYHVKLFLCKLSEFDTLLAIDHIEIFIRDFMEVSKLILFTFMRSFFLVSRF